MKKIFQFVKGTVKFVFGNLDYLAAFGLGAFAYSAQPELLNDIWNAIINFDLAAAWMFIKDSAIYLYDLGVSAYEWVAALFSGEEMMAMEATAETASN